MRGLGERDSAKIGRGQGKRREGRGRFRAAWERGRSGRRLHGEAWRTGAEGRRLGEALFEGEDILVGAPFVGDFVHHLFDEEDAEAADGTFVEGEGDVNVVLLGRVEGDALVDETEDEGIVFEEGFEGDGALNAFGIGIADGIGQCFVEGKVELEGDIGRKAVGIGNLIEERSKLGYFGEGVIESECEHGERFLGGLHVETWRTGEEGG